MELCGRPICVWRTASVHFSHGRLRLTQLPAMMLRCRFTLMNCARPCAGFLTHLIFLSLPRPGDPCPPCGREQGFEVEQAGEVTGECATEQVLDVVTSGCPHSSLPRPRSVNRCSTSHSVRFLVCLAGPCEVLLYLLLPLPLSVKSWVWIWVLSCHGLHAEIRGQPQCPSLTFHLETEWLLVFLLRMSG